MEDNTQPQDKAELTETTAEQAEASTTATDDTVAEQAETTMQRIKEELLDDDPKPSPTMTLRKILGGDILTAELVRRQVWLLLLVFAFTIVYVAFRYQCQQDIILIDKLETELKDAKYKALSSSSTLTERCRESHVLEILKNNSDSTLHIAEQPPYIITVPDDNE